MKLKIILLLLFILVSSIIFYSNLQLKNDQVKVVLNNQIMNLQTHYNITINYFIKDAASIRDNICNNKKALQIFKEAQTATKEQRDILRDKLYKLLLPMYKRIHSRGILQWQFVFPNNISFLRMHKPSKFGDDLTHIRYSFKQANKTKETIIGFEQGRTTHAFRYVFPYYNKQGNHLGAIEISLNSNSLQNKLMNVMKIHSHFLVNKEVFIVKKWETQGLKTKYIQSIENKDYMYTVDKHYNKERLQYSKNNLIAPLRDKIKKGFGLKKPFAVYTPYKNTIKIITFLPIKDTQNKIAAYIVSYTNSSNIYHIYQAFNKINIIGLIVLLIIFYFIYKQIRYKKHLEIEVKNKTKKLQKQIELEVQKNKEIQQLTREVEEREEDLKILNENLEKRVEEEVKRNLETQKQLFKSEKLAAMGEMIGNIAHQWRQPLSVISTGATGMKMQKEFNSLNDEDFIKTCDMINSNAQYLSKTIDDFRNFIKGDRTQTIFNLEEDIDSFLHLIEGSIKSNNINIILNLKSDITLNSYPNELTQCLINIFNNSKDALLENKIENKLVFITTQIKNGKVLIIIKDNAGGIPNEVLPKIFDPYFTTKSSLQGTGLGLNMVYKLIVEGMKGNIEAINENYEYSNKNYIGAKFIISLPIDENKINIV